MSPPDIEHLSATAGEGVLEFSVSIEAGHETFLSLLAWLPEAYELRFYDQFYPSVSDPGAYVSVRRKGRGFVYQLANHGWSSAWSHQSPQLLAAWMALQNSAAFSVHRAHAPAAT
ncbi:hypothetical protein [Lysobacter sp. Root690]|uniref:hypothetical protein n=1 Tax=Lysobacter sp. Root690 TaxID=1736588 RepID=UPI0006FDBBE0|nr:hypothetical protein [Lysobacter sp. Root690]KRB03212.1 hypothetical protein ASD86_20145 [Lysobacter sp. Root690]